MHASTSERVRLLPSVWAPKTLEASWESYSNYQRMYLEVLQGEVLHGSYTDPGEVWHESRSRTVSAPRRCRLCSRMAANSSA